MSRSRDFVRRKPDELIELAHQAVAGGDIADLERSLLAKTKAALRERFEQVRRAREHRNESVAAGRAFVTAYLDYLRYVEDLHGLQ